MDGGVINYLRYWHVGNPIYSGVSIGKKKTTKRLSTAKVQHDSRRGPCENYRPLVANRVVSLPLTTQCRFPLVTRKLKVYPTNKHLLIDKTWDLQVSTRMALHWCSEGLDETTAGGRNSWRGLLPGVLVYIKLSTQPTIISYTVYILITKLTGYQV